MSSWLISIEGISLDIREDIRLGKNEDFVNSVS
jgi:hypothetical protein